MVPLCMKVFRLLGLPLHWGPSAGSALYRLFDGFMQARALLRT